MFESVLTVPLHFTIEFLGFLVTAGGALLVLSRPDLVPGPASNRVYVVLGLGFLGAAQVAHGAAFFPLDGDPLLAAGRALGYALILIGVAGALRPGAAIVVAGFELNEPLLLAPAAVALLVAAAAISMARREETGHYGRLAGAMLLLATDEVLTSMAPQEIFGAGVVDRYALGAHLAKFLGFILLASWMWSAVKSSIRTRFVASFGALLVVVILALSTTLTGVISSSVQTEDLNRIQAQAANGVRTLDIETARLKNTVTNLAQKAPEIPTRMADGTNPRDLARGIRRSALVDEDLANFGFIIVDPVDAPQGVAGRGPFVFSRNGESRRTRLGEEDVIKIMGTPVVKEVRKGTAPVSASAAKISSTKMALIGAARVMDGDSTVGYVIIGRFVDALFMEALSVPPTFASLLIDGEAAVSTLPAQHQESLVIPAELRTRLRLGGNARASAQQLLGQTSYLNGFANIEGGPRRFGTLVISSPTNLVSDTRQGVTRILFVASMLVGAIALVLAYLGGRRITRPIQRLTATVGAVREGDLTAQAEVAGTDEVGRLGETFNEMTASLFKMTNDLRQAAREEHDLRARIETIIASMADGLVAVDKERNILAFNREAEHLTGMTAEVAMGRPIEDVLRARDSKGEPVGLPIAALAAGSVGDIFLKRDKGDPLPVAITSAVLRNDEGDVTGAVAVIRDMSREREVERMKTEFLSNISHELRTPLTPIKGYAEILQRKEVPPEKVKQFVAGILESTARLERIVELLVDFSAMEAGRMAPKTTPVDLSIMLTALIERWKVRAPKHEFVADLPAEQIEVVGDERLLKRSLEEIVDNAVKFSPQGGAVRLAAAMRTNGTDSQSSVEVSVADQGIGISEEDLPKIFSDFQQLDGSETRTYGGLGLGLAFVQRIIEAHNGEIRAESAPDRGTTFFVRLPLAEERKPDVEAVAAEN
ncbi:MAG: ATP-binding protein [Actinomycetota bacterium]